MAEVAGAAEVLRRAERELKTLIAQALADGKYDDVASLARLSEGLAGLRSANGATPGPAISQPAALALPSADGAARNYRTRGRHSARFERDGEALVKIAPSRSPGQAEYEHHAPFLVVETLLDAVRNGRSVGSKFTAAEILPLVERKTRREIPSYQSYLALAWLRSEGVVVKHGRDRYSLKQSVAGAENISRLWKALPARS